MQQTISLKLVPGESSDEAAIHRQIAEETHQPVSAIKGYTILKRSIDARGRQAWVILTVTAFIEEACPEPVRPSFAFREVSRATKSVLIIGAGPGGLFAALKLIEAGIRPILLERGKDVRERRRDLAMMNKEGIVNPESNYCFGEGGAGTYSDGKLYTRSNKRGDIRRILNLLVHFGAQDSILYDAHPHIGTNKLPQIITAIRKQILDCGGIFLFEKKVVDFTLQNDRIKSVHTADGDLFEADAVILATGHSARDIYHLFNHRKILIESKPFALGVRIEHPQDLIDQIQYHCSTNVRLNPGDLLRPAGLPPASYNLVQQVGGRGVFSFCMCPGGIIAPAATHPGELVVNGWSPSKRNNPYANSGIVVSVEDKDLEPFREMGPLAAMYFQQSVEQKAFVFGGGHLRAPAQRMVDFTEKRVSATLPGCSYLPGIHSVSLQEVLPGFIHEALRKAFLSFGKKMRGYYTNEAVLVATESRTSSPVRIPRDKQTFQHPQIRNLFPCGEGAGYAGGIVSAAMDGENIATQVSLIV